MTDVEMRSLREALNDGPAFICDVALARKLIKERDALLAALRTLHAIDGEEMAMYDPTPEYAEAVANAGVALREAKS